MPQPKAETYGGQGIAGYGPEGPHLALVTDTTGLATGIPPGALMYIVEDPKDVSKIFPIVLHKAHHKKLVFICGCGKEGCTRRVEFVGHWKGRHPQSEQAVVR